MNYEPALEKCNEKQIMAFKRTLLIDPDTLAVCLDGNEDAKELHAKRSELKKLARSIVDTAKKEQRSLSESENDAFDVSTALLDDIQCAFDMRSQKDIATRSINNVNNSITGETSTRCLEMWQDDKGKQLPVLGREHRFSDFVSKSGNDISSRDYWSTISGFGSKELRGMSEGNDQKGGWLIPSVVSNEIIDKLRAKSVMVQSGMRTIPLPAPTVRVCKITSDPTASFVNENCLIPDTDFTIGAIDFICHKLTCLIKISKELWQDAGNAATVIENAISTAMAKTLDEAILYSGDGVSKMQSIVNNPDICTYSLGTDGAQLTGYDDLLYGVREIVNANGPVPVTSIMSPRTLIGYSLTKSGDGKPLERPDLIKNMTFLDTTSMPIAEVKGSSGAVCSSILLGGFETVVCGIKNALEIQVLTERYAEYGQIAYLATMRVDSVIFEPKKLCRITGIKP